MKLVEQLSVYIQSDNLIEVQLRVSTIDNQTKERLLRVHFLRPHAQTEKKKCRVGNRIKSFLTLGAPANHHRLWLSDNLKHAGESG